MGNAEWKPLSSDFAHLFLFQTRFGSKRKVNVELLVSPVILECVQFPQTHSNVGAWRFIRRISTYLHEHRRKHFTSVWQFSTDLIDDKCDADHVLTNANVLITPRLIHSVCEQFEISDLLRKYLTSSSNLVYDLHRSMSKNRTDSKLRQKGFPRH